MVREEEETTTGAEVVTGDVVVGVITVAVIWEGAVVTTETVAGVDKEEMTAGAVAFCTTLAAFLLPLSRATVVWLHFCRRWRRERGIGMRGTG